MDSDSDCRTGSDWGKVADSDTADQDRAADSPDIGQDTLEVADFEETVQDIARCRSEFGDKYSDTDSAAHWPDSDSYCNWDCNCQRLVAYSPERDSERRLEMREREMIWTIGQTGRRVWRDGVIRNLKDAEDGQ